MIDPDDVPPVADNELMARFIVYSDHFKGQSVSQMAFLAYKYTDLSTTRHREATVDEIWQAGRDVAILRNRPLYGRADIQAGSCRQIGLSVDPDPSPVEEGVRANPNHALIHGFPNEKQEQMSFAQLLAAAANEQGGFKPAP